MKSKKIIGLFVLACCLVTACKKDTIDQHYTGSNDLISEVPSGGIRIQEGSEKISTVTVHLTLLPTHALDLPLEWEAAPDQADPEDIFQLSSKVLHFEAGERTKTFTIASTGAGNRITKLSQYFLKIILPENNEQQLVSNTDIEVYISPVDDFPEFNEEQQRRLQESPVNIGLWTGIVGVEVSVDRYEGGWYGFEKAQKFAYTGTSVIVPNDTATNISTLDIRTNAFGLNDYFYSVFRGETIDLSVPEISGFNPEILDLVNWTDNSVESFKMTLPNLVFLPDAPGAKKGAIRFSALEEDSDPPAYLVPFSYVFSANNRMNEFIAQGNEEASYYEDLLEPSYTLQAMPDKEPELDGQGTYNEETGEMQFTLRLTHSNASDEPDKIVIKYQSPQITEKK
ncbi:MAG: DUF4929 family protein [Sphingobacterium sp.]|uniref:DUF4929 family protein n=1 Tax=Sphingobacterium sp. JB170 TaxID=1434842 RepID=UPI0015C5896C|nr:DUF4929 family protein [Sphingobacterium sp. JB170]